MVKNKKLFAVVLALVMLVSCFVVSASALTYAPTNTTGEVAIIATSDKTTVKDGDVVTITMSIDPGTKTSFSAFTLPVIYNGDQLTPTNTGTAFRTWLGDCATSFAKDEATVNMNYNTTNALGAAFTADEKSYYTKGIVVAGQTAGGATARWNPAAGGEDFVSFQFTVTDAVKAGDEIWVGFHQAAVTRSQGFFSVDNKRLAATDYNLTNSMVKLTVAEDKEPTIVNPLKGQIRFDKKDGAYAGTFDVRALATITEKDFNATFTDAATAEDMIEEIGFVFAAGSNVGTPDMAGVKALVENGTALSGYEKKTVDYISTGATNVDAGNYVFSCIVTDVPDADKADSLVAVGYIKWTDAEGTHYNYYPSAQEISFNALYTAHYNRAFPQA